MSLDRTAVESSVHRLRAALDACREPLLVTGPDDAIEYANGQLASAVGAPQPSLRGREWTSLFTDDAIDRLRRQAIPVASEGWQWSGTATLSTDDGPTRPVRTNLVGLEDGSTVVVLGELESDADS